jgi:hypothetical protein
LPWITFYSTKELENVGGWFGRTSMVKLDTAGVVIPSFNVIDTVKGPMY